MNIDVDHYIARYITVYLDGRDMTNNCFFAELADMPGIEAEGKMGVYPRDENGQRIIVRDEYGAATDVKQEYLSGVVMWQWKSYAPERIKSKYLHEHLP